MRRVTAERLLFRMPAPASRALRVKVVMDRGVLAPTALSARTHQAEQSLALIAPRAGTTQDLMAQKPTSTLSTTARSVPPVCLSLKQGRMLRTIAMDCVVPTHTQSQSDRRRILRAAIVRQVTFRHKARVPAPPARQGLQARQEVVVVRLAALTSGHPRDLQCACRVETDAALATTGQETALHAALDFI